MDRDLRERLIDLFTAVVEHDATRTDIDLINTICEERSDDVIKYLRDNHIGFYANGERVPWVISKKEAKSHLKKLN